MKVRYGKDDQHYRYRTSHGDYHVVLIVGLFWSRVLVYTPAGEVIKHRALNKNADARMAKCISNLKLAVLGTAPYRRTS